MKTFRLRRLFGLVIVLAVVLGISPPSMGATTVKRNISQDTTWKKRKSPYVVTKNIVVEKGATLKIEPGARVELAADTGIEIRGNFLAIGTPDKPIVFTSRTDKPWGTLHFTDFSDDAAFTDDGRYLSGCILQNCVIEKGGGIFVRFGAPLIADCAIRNNFSSGIRVEFGGPRVVRNRISGNSTQHDPASGNGGGIIAYTDKNVLIADNIISNNISDGGRDGGGGVYAYASDKAQIIVRNNTIFGNTSSRFGGGIYAYNSILAGNRVINNSSVERGGGIYAVESRLVENLVQSNSSKVGGGVYADNSEVVSNSIIRNVAEGPEGGALNYFGSGNIRDNSLISNTAAGTDACGGIYVSGNPDIKANNIFNNSGYALYVANVEDAPQVSAQGNFWGTSSEQAILGLIYDWLDNENVGLATISPCLEHMSPGTPPPPPFNLLSCALKDGIGLSWDEPEGISFDGHTVHVGTEDGYPYPRVERIGAERKFTIQGLEPGAEYWIAVSGYRHVEETEMKSGFSEEIRVRVTASEASLPRPEILSITDAEKNRRRYKVCKASLPEGEDRAVAFRWQVSAFEDNFVTLVIDETKSGDELFHLNLKQENLIPGEEYFCRVACRTATGSWSAWSNSASFTLEHDDRSTLAGPISSEVKLEKRYSPYRIVGNTLITQNGALLIEPGVRVTIAPGKNLMVRGKLVARGTASEPIVFTRQSPEKWGRLIFADACKDVTINDAGDYVDGCVLERCIVEHGKGILIKSASPLIKDCAIAYHDGSGIAVRQGGPIITGNDIHHNVAPTNGGGIYAYTNDVAYVRSNKIHDNRADGDGGGVFAYGYKNTSAIRVEGNSVFSNTATGDGGGIYLSRSSAVDNIIESNHVNGNGGGIFATFGLVKGNELRNNQAERGGGIFAEQNSSITRNEVVLNKAESGFGGGVYINFWGASIENESFMENTVTKNLAPAKEDNGGVFIVGYLFFEKNNIYDNTGSQLYNGNEAESYTLRVTQCYWGTDDINAISKQIMDGEDRPDLGKVAFEPFSREPLKFD